MDFLRGRGKIGKVFLETWTMHMRTLPYRLAAIDIDDTLIGPDKTPSPLNIRKVRELQERGVRVILATGRSRRNMTPYCRALGLSDTMVATYGARVWHSATGETLHQMNLPAREAREVIEEGRRRGLEVICFTPEGVLAEGPTAWVAAIRQAGGGEEPLHWARLDGAERDDVERVVWLGAAEALGALEEEVTQRLAGRLTVIRTLPFALEFFAAGVNKAVGVEAVARLGGIAPEEVMAFGDSAQDLPMLEWAGLGVAMPHGPAELLEAAERVAPEGDPETALARAIDEILKEFDGRAD